MLPQHLLKMIHETRNDCRMKLDHAKRSMRVHTESDAITGIQTATEFIVDLNAELEVWDEVLTCLEDRALCDLEADVALTYQTLRTRAANQIARLSFRNLNHNNFYEAKSLFVVAGKLQMLAFQTIENQDRKIA